MAKIKSIFIIKPDLILPQTFECSKLQELDNPLKRVQIVNKIHIHGYVRQ